MKRLFTTGDVARFCHVTINTVVKWNRLGVIKGFKIPDSGARRFTREEIEEFMRSHNFPLDYMIPPKTKILVVNEERDVRSLFKKTFPGSEGFQVFEAANGFEAGLNIPKEEPHFIFMDLKLSDGDGREACRLFKKSIPGGAKARIFALTGKLSDAEAQSLKKDGFDDFLKKPVTAEKIEALVEKYRE